MDPNSVEGQREIAAKRDRDVKNIAKAECISRFNSIENHLTHWAVSFLFLNLVDIMWLQHGTIFL